MRSRPEELNSLRVVNVFARVDFKARLNLAELAGLIPGSEYDPGNVSGVIVRTLAPRACITIYSSGIARCTGARSVDEALVAIEGIATLLRNVGLSLQDPAVEVKNVVCLFDLGADVDLARLARLLPGTVEYEPEQFPGATVRLGSNGSLLLFRSGKVVVTGVRTVEEAEEQRLELVRVLKDTGLV